MSDKVRDSAKSPKRRRDQTYELFESKVCLLEEWAKDGLPYKAYYPLSHAALRRWTGPEGTFGVWKDPTIDRVRTGKYPALADRFVNAISSIKNRKYNSSNDIEKVKSAMEKLKTENTALFNQNAELISRIDALERKNRLLKALADAKAT